MSETIDAHKTCPKCGRKFTRRELRLNANQWFLRIYCSRKCYMEVKKQES